MVYPAVQQSDAHPTVSSSDKREETIHIMPRANCFPWPGPNKPEFKPAVSSCDAVLHRHIIRHSELPVTSITVS